MTVDDERLPVLLYVLSGYLLGQFAEGVERLGPAVAVDARVAFGEAFASYAASLFWRCIARVRHPSALATLIGVTVVWLD